MPAAGRRPKGRQMNPRTLQESLARGPAFPLYVLEGGERKEGTDRIAIERCLTLIRSKVLSSAQDSDWNLTILTGERVGIAQILDAAMTLPLLGGQRLVIVRGASEITAPRDEAGQKVQIEGLERMASGSPTSVVVLVEPPLDGRLKVHKALVERACVVSCASPSPQQMPVWLAAEARSRGLDLAPGTAESLAEIVGTDTLTARQELEKLQLYVTAGEGSRPATPEDVSALAAGGAIADAWKMCDAVASLDVSRALRLARELCESGEEEVALIGALAFRLRQMIEAAEAFERGVPLPGILASVRAWGATRTVLEANISRYDAQGLLQGLRELYGADRMSKRGGDPEEALLSAISRIIRAGARSPVFHRR